MLKYIIEKFCPYNTHGQGGTNGREIQAQKLVNLKFRNFIKNNWLSLVFLGIALLCIVGIIILAFYNPSDDEPKKKESVEDDEVTVDTADEVEDAVEETADDVEVEETEDEVVEETTDDVVEETADEVVEEVVDEVVEETADEVVEAVEETTDTSDEVVE